MQNISYRLVGLAAFLLLPSALVFAQDEVFEVTSEEAWEVTRELLDRREYAIATDFLESLADDPSNAKYIEAFQADIKAISGLQSLSDSLEAVVETLKENDEFTDRDIKYVFKRYEETPDGHSIIVKTNSGQEQALTVYQLHSRTLLELAGRSENPVLDELTAGIFLAFDKDADMAAATSKLEQAASNGQDIKIWAERANKTATEPVERGALPSTDESIAGNWFVKFDKGRTSFRIVILEDGRVTGLGKSWQKGSDDYYLIDFPRHGVAKVIFVGTRFFGKFPSGRIIKGVR